MVDPTDNPKRIQRIRILAENWRIAVYEGAEWHDQLVAEVRDAKLAGHSYRQLAEAAGLPLSEIQQMLQ
jgi:hypothetical protein